MKEPFLYQLVASVIKAMKDFYPYLVARKEHIERLYESRRNTVLNTLSHGEELLRGALANSKN